MGGDDSQKLLPRRGVHSSPGRKPPAQLTKSTISLILAVGLSRGAPWTLGLWPQLQPAWVIFGKHRWVNSGARRSAIAKDEVDRITITEHTDRFSAEDAIAGYESVGCDVFVTRRGHVFKEPR